jgi:3-hydroxyisobutyrate dehydrogenase-like beta-hydroxyacid dehydrogenase
MAAKETDMAKLDNSVFDAALNEVATATRLTICSSDPADYAGIAAVLLGSKSSPGFTGPADGDVSGRKITINAISDGSVTATGEATHWALDDGSTLLASGDLASSQEVTNGNTFTLTATDIELRDPA